jgi:hypothetical protein
MKTLGAVEAAAFLNIDIDTLRQRTKQGKIPGGKVGRAYVYVEDDLLQFVRSRYKRPADSEGTRWGCTNDKALPTTGFGSATAGQKLDKALAQILGKKPSRLRHERNSRSSNATASA